MIEIDESQWPVVVAHKGGRPKSKLGEADATHLIAHLEEVLRRKERFATVFAILPTTQAAMSMLHSWIPANKDILGEQCAGIVVVVEPAVLATNRRMLAEVAGQFEFQLGAATTIEGAVEQAQRFLAVPTTTPRD